MRVLPFSPHLSELDAETFRQKLTDTRFPDAQTVDDWSQGVPLEVQKQLCKDLIDHDFRPCLEQIAGFGSYKTDVSGLDLHFLHITGPRTAKPMILTHGWPGGIIEFLDVIDALSQHVPLVIPSLPGYGYSARPKTTGWGLERIADAWAALMEGLGYDRYSAQGGDWGAEVSALLAQRHPDACIGAHINLVSAKPPKAVLTAPTEAEAIQLQRQKQWGRMEMAYFRQQASRPQTQGYALADSPSGQAAWIAEKFHAWTDSTPDRPFGSVRYDRLLDLICLYWFTNTATSSARLYWESGYGSGRTRIDAPVACSLYPAEIMAPSQRWAETRFTQIIRWTEQDRGGHFAAMETPDLFVTDALESAEALWSAR